MAQDLVGNDPTLVMTRFRPGVRKEDEGPAERIFGEPLHKKSGIVSVESNIRQIVVPDPSQKLRHSVNEWFASDNTGSGVSHCLPCEMFAPAEADFQPDIVKVWAETGPRIENIGRHGVYFQLRKQVFDQIPLARAQTPVPATPVNGTSLTGLFVRAQLLA